MQEHIIQIKRAVYASLTVLLALAILCAGGITTAWAAAPGTIVA